MGAGVVALDLKLIDFKINLYASIPECSMNSVTCFTMDLNGFVQYHDKFLEISEEGLKENVFVSELHGDIAVSMINNGILKTKSCVDYLDGDVQTNFVVDETSNKLGILHTLGYCGSYIALNVPGTNMIVVMINGNGCTSPSTECLPCTRENCESGLNGLLCQPCACSVEYDGCSQTYNISNQAKVIYEDPPPCPVSPEPQLLGSTEVCDQIENNFWDLIAFIPNIIYIGISICFVCGAIVVGIYRNKKK